MKRILLWMLYLSLAIFPFSNADALSFKGDLDSDGTVTLQDAIMAVRIASGMDAGAPVHMSAEVGRDHKIGIIEGIYALQCLSGTRRPAVSLPTGSLAGTVTLPPGVTANIKSLKVTNSLATARISEDGSFSLEGFTDGKHLAFVVGPSGKPMLLGWLDATRTVLNARSTAEALLYMITGCFALPADARRTALDLIGSSPEAAQVAQVIESSLAENADALAMDNSSLRDALSSAAASLAAGSGVPFSGPASTRSPQGVIVNPIAEKSGLRVNLIGINTMVLRNKYRRPGYAYIEQISYVPEAGGAAVTAKKALTEFAVAPVLGLNGLLGTIGDIAAGNMAYTEVDSAPVELPMAAGAKKTTYKLTVVGPGSSSGDYGSLTEAQKQKQSDTTLLFIAKDLVLPFLVNIILPNLDGKVDLFADLGNGGVGADFLAQMASLPGLMEQAATGDILGAFRTAVDGLLKTATFQQLAIKILTDGISNFGDSATKDLGMELGNTVFRAITFANEALVGLDAAAITAHANASNYADVWTIDVTKPTVRLTPADSETHAFAYLEFKCSLAEAVGGDVLITYRWSTTGRGGSLADALHSGTSFNTNADTVKYIAEKGVAATDSVTVEVFRRDGNVSTSLGTAQARVKVNTGHVTITPSAVTIAEDTKPTFTAKVTGADGPFIYEWSTARDGLRDGNGDWQRSIETEANSAQFGRADGAPGDREVRVTVYKTVDGNRYLVGTATAKIRLETYKIPAAVYTRYSAVQSEPGQYGYPYHWFFGFNLGVQFAKITDAASYTVYLKNDNEFYYWGKDPVFSGPPSSQFLDLGDSFLCWQYGGGGQGPEPVPTEAEMVAPYIGYYSGGTYYAIPGFGR